MNKNITPCSCMMTWQHGATSGIHQSHKMGVTLVISSHKIFPEFDRKDRPQNAFLVSGWHSLNSKIRREIQRHCKNNVLKLRILIILIFFSFYGLFSLKFMEKVSENGLNYKKRSPIAETSLQYFMMGVGFIRLYNF